MVPNGSGEHTSLNKETPEYPESETSLERRGRTTEEARAGEKVPGIPENYATKEELARLLKLERNHKIFG